MFFWSPFGRFLPIAFGVLVISSFLWIAQRSLPEISLSYCPPTAPIPKTHTVIFSPGTNSNHDSLNSKTPTVPVDSLKNGDFDSKPSRLSPEAPLPESGKDTPPAYKSSKAPTKDDKGSSKSNKDISYDVKTPPSTGCEDVVSDLQRKLIEAYSERLKGIRYANIWGYLETENKGDAAIWSAQQILLSILGIETMEACRFMDKGCDIEKFRAKLEEHRPHSAIIMAGGGNFNDYYWEDQPSRMAMIEAFTNVSVRAFPQSIHMKISDRINKTKVAFEKHKDLQLAARDRPSHDWLVKTFGNSTGIQSDLVPDIAFMWGNRPDFRLNGNKTHDLLILARKDLEISKGDSSKIAFGKGTIDLGGDIGNITYHKVDWKFTSTPGIDAPKKKPAASEAKKPDSNDEKKPDAKDDKKPDTKDDKKPGAKDDKKPNIKGGDKPDTSDSNKSATKGKRESKASEPNGESAADKDTIEFKREEGKNQRAWAKSVAGFELLGSARFVITDRLHGHILSTIIGVPHVLMDSKLGKNINFHDTWTRDCACTRVASNIDEALEIARLWFEEEKKTIANSS